MNLDVKKERLIRNSIVFVLITLIITTVAVLIATRRGIEIIRAIRVILAPAAPIIITETTVVVAGISILVGLTAGTIFAKTAIPAKEQATVVIKAVIIVTAVAILMSLSTILAIGATEVLIITIVVAGSGAGSIGIVVEEAVVEKYLRNKVRV